MNPATRASRDALRRLGDKQPMGKEKGKHMEVEEATWSERKVRQERETARRFHLKPRGEISLKNNQLLCCN